MNVTPSDQNPLISVICCFYNEEIKYAQEAIDSIIHQTYRNLEIILVLDNPGNTALKQLLAEYTANDNRITTIFNTCNIGLPRSLNKAIDHCTGDYIARMDGDDISELNRISSQLHFMIQNPDIDLCGSDALIIDENSHILGIYKKLRTDFSQKAMLKHASINLIHPTWFGKTSLFKKIRYRSFWHVEDYDFLLRSYAYGATFANIQQPLLQTRINQSAIVSVSRLNAYQQYRNATIARKQFCQYLKSHDSSLPYPDLPDFNYDPEQLNRFNSTVTMVTKLRTQISQKKLSALLTAIKIMIKDHRPITSRIRVWTFHKILDLAEKTNLTKILN